MSLAALGRNLPDLHTAAARGAEINPLSITGPTRDNIFGGFGCQTAHLATFGADDIDIGVALLAGIIRARIEGDPAAIRRPSRCTGEIRTTTDQQHRICAISVAHPDSELARAVGRKNDLPPVRGEMRPIIIEC